MHRGLGLVLILGLTPAWALGPDWEDGEPEQDAPSLYREVSYESYGRPGGLRSHEWAFTLSRKRAGKTGFFLTRNEYPGSPIESHMLGFHGSKNFSRAGLKASYALRDRNLSGTQGRNYLSAAIRLSPRKDCDFLVGYDRLKEEFASGEEDLDSQRFTFGLKLSARNAFRVRLAYAGEDRMRVRMSYRW